MDVARECCRCGECPPRGNRNSDGWQKCFTNVPPGASRVSADHNVKNVFSSICDAVDGECRRWLYDAKLRRSGRGASLTTIGVDTKCKGKRCGELRRCARSSTLTPTSTFTSHNMLKYSHAKFATIRNHLASYWRGAYCRAIGDCVVADSRREGKGTYCRLVGIAAFMEDCFADGVRGIRFAWIGEER